MISLGKLEGGNGLTYRPRLVHPLGTIIKPDSGKVRNVIDPTATGLNDALTDLPTKYDMFSDAVNAIHPGSWLAAIDLKDAYCIGPSGGRIGTCSVLNTQ